ncbi:MAG TPA: enoyl-CoA hydratase/isomerase family protein [Oligoflexia bacterium]|nr:enoyl-CoA hydratase/isomerase family protein [Oligoflexia bacterium]HMP27457.1 enoyl-CoA hydratase/isomerase family protein [Oligoflexia bacterium]
MTSTIKHAIDSERVLTITLNRPEQLNAMDLTMAAEFEAIVKSNLNNNLRGLIITGAGKAFSTGGDLGMLKQKQTQSEEQNYRDMRAFYKAFLSILDLNVPTVAAINGPAIGAGLCLATACDLRVADIGAKLGFTFAKLGLYPGMGATFFLPRVIGQAKALELLATARVLSAQEGYEIGLVNKLAVAENNAVLTAKKLLEEIALSAPTTTTKLINTFRKELSKELESALEQEAKYQSIDYRSAEFNEGLKAVIEKRKPIWDRYR